MGPIQVSNESFFLVFGIFLKKNLTDHKIGGMLSVSKLAVDQRLHPI
jgi:hypothetical protein